MRWLPACGGDVSAASHSGLSSVILPPSSEVVGHTNSERPTLWSLLLLRHRCVVRVDLLASATDSLFFFFFVYVACVNGRTYAVLFSFSVAATSRTTTATTTTRASCIRVSYILSFLKSDFRVAEFRFRRFCVLLSYSQSSLWVESGVVSLSHLRSR